MGLSVTEKQELRSIVEKRIGRRIQLLEDSHKEEIELVTKQASSTVYDDLGITQEWKTILDLRVVRDEATKAVTQAEQALWDRIGNGTTYNSLQERLNALIIKRSKELAEQAKLAAPFYAEVLDLREEARRLDEFVWTATSTKQVAELFKALNEVLSETPTKLEKAAQEIERPE